ncbi:MAG: hypothetical protein ACRDF0_00925, partial [Candidatus Limnocylindria bacterium]
AIVRRAAERDAAPRDIAGDRWARIVYDFLIATKRRPDEIERFVRALVPLYFARVAAFIEEARDLTTAESEALVEAQARAFEDQKGHLRARWDGAA